MSKKSDEQGRELGARVMHEATSKIHDILVNAIWQIDRFTRDNGWTPELVLYSKLLADYRDRVNVILT